MNHKVIQQRLSRRGLSLSSAQIKEYLSERYLGEKSVSGELLEIPSDDVSKVVDELLALHGQKIVLGDQQQLTEVEKSELVGSVATTLSVDLSIEQIQEISQKIDWVTTSRKAGIEEIESAIIAWIDYQIEQDSKQTTAMIGRIEKHFNARLQENNRRLTEESTRFSRSVDRASESFRTSKTEILDLFKIPS